MGYTGVILVIMEITNKTKKPLSVPLLDGKKLFLSPGKSGQITPKAASSPGVVKLLEAGDVALSEVGAKPHGGGNTGLSSSSVPRQGASGAMRQSGDK